MLDMIERYSEEHRHYHNFNHISQMLSNMKVYSLTESEKIILRLAILYHDYIYFPERKDNETKSANEFLLRLMNNKIEFDEDVIGISKVAGAVNIMILNTIEHEPNFYMSKFLIDLDLWDLHNEEDYFSDKNLIRKEFSMFSDEQFIKGRIKWVRHMLNKSKIFYTNYCISNKFEESARRILMKDLKILESFK